MATAITVRSVPGERFRQTVAAGDLDETQRKRLLEIATRCPVHRTLSSEIKIRTSAV